MWHMQKEYTILAIVCILHTIIICIHAAPGPRAEAEAAAPGTSPQQLHADTIPYIHTQKVYNHAIIHQSSIIVRVPFHQKNKHTNTRIQSDSVSHSESGVTTQTNELQMRRMRLDMAFITLEYKHDVSVQHIRYKWKDKKRLIQQLHQSRTEAHEQPQDFQPSLSQASDSDSDRLAGFGLTRLQCGTQLFDSHPFPFDTTHTRAMDAVPAFLIPVCATRSDVKQATTHFNNKDSDLDSNDSSSMLWHPILDAIKM
jgi:hypothetical protein